MIADEADAPLPSIDPPAPLEAVIDIPSLPLAATDPEHVRHVVGRMHVARQPAAGTGTGALVTDSVQYPPLLE